MNKNLISALLYLIIILMYAIIKDYEPLFMWLAWCAGFWKDSFRKTTESTQ